MQNFLFQTFTLNEERNVTLTAMVQPFCPEMPYAVKRPAIIVIPGGAYQYCSDREAEPVAFPYLQMGYHAFVLRYSLMDDSVWPNPLEDYEQAAELIKAHAEEWGVMTDKIAVIGFSAGGHLAAMAATIARNKPAAAILCYPATKVKFWKWFDKEIDHRYPDAPSAVDTHTCPCYLFATCTDELASVENSLDFASALLQHKIPFEMHIYGFGPHGLTLAEGSLQPQDGSFTPRAVHWVEESKGWLKEVLGDFSQNGFTAPVCPPRLNDDLEEHLSDRCTVALLHRVKQSDELLAPLFEKAREAFSEYHGVGLKLVAPVMFDFYGSLTLRTFAAAAGIGREELARYAEALSRIKNPEAAA